MPWIPADVTWTASECDTDIRELGPWRGGVIFWWLKGWHTVAAGLSPDWATTESISSLTMAGIVLKSPSGCGEDMCALDPCRCDMDGK